MTCYKNCFKKIIEKTSTDCCKQTFITDWWFFLILTGQLFLHKWPVSLLLTLENKLIE